VQKKVRRSSLEAGKQAGEKGRGGADERYKLRVWQRGNRKSLTMMELDSNSKPILNIYWFQDVSKRLEAFVKTKK
jgi:hypothetical protein